MSRGKMMYGRANKKSFRRGYYKAVAKSVKGIPMARNGGHL